MNNEPLISVIVPIYKVEQYLDECVSSIVNQTYQNLEIILVDDGSPDNCPKMCDEWAKKDSRIRVLHKSNGGLSDARNAGIDAAHGEYLGFVDSDDFVDEQMYEKLIESFSMGEDIAISSIKVYKYKGGETSVFAKDWDINEARRIEGNDFAVMMLSQKCCFTAWNKLYLRKIVNGVRFRKGRNNEDSLFMFDLGLNLKKNKKAMIELPYTAYFYRVRPESICTTAKKPLVIDTIRNIEDMMSECHGDIVLFDTLRERYAISLYEFCDSLLLDTESKQVYFNTYQTKLKSIPFKVFSLHYQINDLFYIFLLRYCPSIRAFIRKRLKSFIPSIKSLIGVGIARIMRIYSPKFHAKYKYQKSRLYNLWIKPEFKFVGVDNFYGCFKKLVGAKYISIGSHCSIADDCYLTAWDNIQIEISGTKNKDPEISIGSFCVIGAHNHITATNRIVIGDGFLSGKWVTITDNSHGNYDVNNPEDIEQWQTVIPYHRPTVSKGPVIIGKSVWVGDKVTILPSVTIGDGVVIGANSVVTKDVPPYCIVAGNPAKILKQLKF